MKLEFDPIADAVYFEISAAEVANTKEIEPEIIGDYDAEKNLVGIAVLSVSKPHPHLYWIRPHIYWIRPHSSNFAPAQCITPKVGPPK